MPPLGEWQLLEYDEQALRATFVRRIEEPTRQGWEVKTEYYVDPVIDANKTEFNANDKSWKGDYHKIASLSPAVAYGDGYFARAMKEGDEKSAAKWLNDSENRSWRTKEGKV